MNDKFISFIQQQNNKNTGESRGKLKMQQFKINESMEVICKSLSTKNGFKHEAKLFINGAQIGKAQIGYLNRTWESYQFQSVLSKLADKYPLFKEAEQQAKVINQL